jgi:hypothetical protein
MQISAGSGLIATGLIAEGLLATAEGLDVAPLSKCCIRNRLSKCCIRNRRSSSSDGLDDSGTIAEEEESEGDGFLSLDDEED